eukprot:10200075-Heterocapsa_arctica.AAC.1
MDTMRTKLKNESTQRGKKGNGALIVNNGGSVQMKDRMKLAEEPWGGLWAVEAEELPKLNTQKMPIITEDE